MGEQLVAVGTFRAKAAARNRRLGIALNRNQLSFIMKDQLAAANGAIGTYRPGYLGAFILRSKVACGRS